MRISAIVVLSALALGGCATMTPQERRANDEIACRDYGFRPMTTGFAECLQRIDLDRRADRRAFLYGDPFPPRYRYGFYRRGPFY